MIGEKELNILIIEDDTIDRISVERFLKDACPQYRCVIVDTVDLARLAIKMEHFDVVITDYKIYDQTGFDILEMKPNAPVIFMTGKGDEETAVRALSSGAYDYLVKDKDSRFLKVLPRTIENTVRRYRAEAIAHKVQFEESIAGVFSIDLNGSLIDCNRAFANMLGYISVNDIMQNIPSGEACCEPGLMKGIMASGSVANAKACFFGREGQEICGLVNAKLVQHGPGEPQVVNGSMLDLTEHMATEERKNLLENQLQTMQKLEALGTLAGGIAHDFNNLLGAIQGYSELALEEVPNESTTAENIVEVLSACTHARDLVSQIMSFGHRRQPKRDAFSLEQLIGEHISLINPSIPDGVNVVFKNQLEGEHAQGGIIGDRVQLGQVFINLITNAMYAMKDVKGELRIDLYDVSMDETFRATHPTLTGEGHYCIAVRDAGVGMSAEIRKKIFEPFFTTKPVGEGTGMGLAVVHGIVRNHGGVIEVDSVRGKGTEFRVYLEHSRTPPEIPVVNKSERSSQVKGNLERILLVDDDQTSLRVVGKLLARLNYQVVTCHGPDDAIKLMGDDASQYDLIISDFMMPSMNGIELVRELRKSEHGTPIMMYTGYDQLIKPEDLQSLGIHQVLLKPVGLKELSEAIPAALVPRSKMKK